MKRKRYFRRRKKKIRIVTKYKLLLYFIAFLIILINIIYSFSKKKNTIREFNVVNVYIPAKSQEYQVIKLDNLTCSYYTNIEEETDSTPNIMASGRVVYNGAIALSRDLIKKYNLKFGDLVKINGRYYVLEDTMNARIKNWVDLFTFSKSNTTRNLSFKCKAEVIRWNRKYSRE